MRKIDNPEPGTWTRWMFTDATSAMNCPRCLAKYGQPCRTPKGRKALIPHGERTKALHDTGYDANRIESAT
jgi:hypothetical protein